MKKLMFMLAAIACAVAAQAATFKWSTGMLTVPGDDSTPIASDNGTWSAVLSLYTDEAMTTAVTGASGLTASAPSAGALGATVSGLETGETYYGVITVTGTYEGKDYEIKITDPVQAKFKASGTTQMNFSTAITSAGGWKGGGGDVPEPTSGLLLLVGAGMLALRRKQK